MSPVTLYEDAGFAGRSVVLAVGQRRFFFPQDFKDVASSLQGSPGLVAIIYEHAEDLGGYGISVDLMEDCPDLGTYGFDNKVSYVTVFPAVNGGFVWARATGSGDSYVPGHWERARAGGQLPPNPG